MAKYVIEGPRTLTRISDEKGGLVAYVGGSGPKEMESRAQVIIHALEELDVTNEVMRAIMGRQEEAVKRAVDQAVQQAVAKEREECARIAFEYGARREPIYYPLETPSDRTRIAYRHQGECAASSGIADLIRNRGKR